MNTMSHVALKKLNDLMNREDFFKVYKVTTTHIILEFEDKTCTVDFFGKCQWEDIYG